MNILYVALESSNFVISLCNEMCKQGHKVTAVVQNEDAYDKDNPITMHENLKREDISIELLSNANLVKSKLLKIAQKEKFDIVFGSHAPIAETIKTIGNMTRIPWGIMLLDIPVDLMKLDRNRALQWFDFFEHAKYAYQIIFNTYVARDSYEKFTNQYFPDRNVIPYATEVIKEYDLSGINIHGDYVLSICRLTKIKNCIAIANALSLLNSPKKYIAVGRDCGQLQMIKDICKKSGIKFEHKDKVTQKEKFELIKNSSMLVYPQITEHIGGLSPFEAMYAGKPALVFDYKILRDLYGSNAFYAAKTVPALAREIAFLHSLKRGALHEELVSGNKYMKEVATFEVMAARMIKVFEEMIK